MTGAIFHPEISGGSSGPLPTCNDRSMAHLQGFKVVKDFTGPSVRAAICRNLLEAVANLVGVAGGGSFLRPHKKKHIRFCFLSEVYDTSPF